MSEKLDLNTVSQQLGIKIKNSNSGDLQAQTFQSDVAGIVALEEDSQPAETNPLFKMLLLGGALFGTVGLGLIVMLWGAGDNNQQAKKSDVLPKEQVAATLDQQKEVADLKASLVMNQQKLDASKLTAAKNPTATATPTTAVTTTQPQAATQPSKQQNIAPVATKPVATMQPSPQDTAQLAALDRAKQQETAQLNALRQSVQQGTSQLAALRQAGQQQATELSGLTERVKKERQNLATLRQQRNSSNSVKTYSPVPTRVAQRQTIAANYRSPTAKQPEMNWEEASALASYGGTQELEPTLNNPNNTIQPVNSVVNALAISPLLRLPVGQMVGGRLVTPFYTLISNSDGQQATQKASATVTIDKAIEVGSGWRLPAGTAIEFDFQVADNGMIQAVSKKVTYGNTEISIPPGAFILTGNDNQPIFAQIKEVNSDKLASADLRSAIFGGAAELGNVLVNGGNNSTVSIGAGTAIATTNNGNPNIIGAIFKGAFSPLTQTQISRSQTLATRLEKQSKVGYLTPGTTMRVYVALAATFQIPTDNPLTQASNPFQTGTGYAPITRVAQIPAIASADLTSSPLNNRLPLSTAIPTQIPTTTVISNPYNPTLAQPPVTPAPTSAPQSTQPPATNTRTSRLQSTQLPATTTPTQLPYPQLPATTTPTQLPYPQLPATTTPTQLPYPQLPATTTNPSQSPSPQPLVKVDTTQGQLVIQAPGIPVQIPPIQLPKLPINIRSIFPR
jgi:hypothetical protein